MENQKPYNYDGERRTDLLWNDLCGRLDRIMPEDKVIRPFWWLLPGGLMLVLVIGIVWSKQENKNNSSQTQTPLIINAPAVNEHARNKTSDVHTDLRELNRLNHSAPEKKTEYKPPSQAYPEKRKERNTISHSGMNKQDEAGRQQKNLSVKNSLINQKEGNARSLQKEPLLLPDESLWTKDTDLSFRQRLSYIQKQEGEVPALPIQQADYKSRITFTEETRKKEKSAGFVAGLSLNRTFPLDDQKHDNLNMKGSQGSLPDYLPSLFGQYHFNNKWYVQTELQYFSPQYVPGQHLYFREKMVTEKKKLATSVILNKMYYFNLPLTVHYKPVSGFSLGAGIQYSYLYKSILTSEFSEWRKNSEQWNQTGSEKAISVKSNPKKEKEKEKKKQISPPGQAVHDLVAVDTVAQSLQGSDWRILLETNYAWHRFVLGARVNLALGHYVNMEVGQQKQPVRDRNESLQVFVRYQLLDRRKKK